MKTMKFEELVKEAKEIINTSEEAKKMIRVLYGKR